MKPTELKSNRTYFLIAFVAFVNFGFGQNNKNEVSKDKSIFSFSADSLNHESVGLNAEDVEKAFPVQEKIPDSLQPIRENFSRINKIKNWSSVKHQELWETTEGGEGKFYYLNKQLEKIIVHRYGETFQYVAEYYLLNGKLSFVFERLYEYNRPLYYDSTDMKENNDTEVFDFDKSKVTETRSYFGKGRLIAQKSTRNNRSSIVANSLINEQNKIETEFRELIKHPNRQPSL